LRDAAVIVPDLAAAAAHILANTEPLP
jgi:hypothetical protein